MGGSNIEARPAEFPASCSAVLSGKVSLGPEGLSANKAFQSVA